MRDCQHDGHILYADDPECLACNQPVTQGEPIAIHAQHSEGASQQPADTATPEEWGTAG